MPLGQTATITYQARIGDGVVAAQMLENEAQLTYASLPGGNSGASERRDSSDIDFSMYDPVNPPRADGSIVNNYGDIALETVTITIPDGIEKTTDKETPQDAVGDYTIGEQIVYTIDVPIIEGVTEDATLVDQLPSGIFFVQTGASDLDSIVARINGVTPIIIQSVSIIDTPAGQQLTIEFGDITNPGGQRHHERFHRGRVHRPGCEHFGERQRRSAGQRRQPSNLLANPIVLTRQRSKSLNPILRFPRPLITPVRSTRRI